MARDTKKKPPKPRTPATIDPTARVIQTAAAWWEQELADVPRGKIQKIHLAAAMGDVYLMASAHLAQRLADPDVPPETKDRIALRCAPLVSIQIRPSRGEERPPADPSTDEASDEARLLAAYSVTPDHRVQ